MRIVFASSNPGKIKELQSLLQETAIHIVPQSEWGIPDAEETGLSFVENAIIKARHACLATGLPAIADDSGLEVPALKGAPGIYSARYAGPEANAKANMQKLLHDMQDIPLEERQANFHCVLVYLSHAEDPTPLICQGIWHGRILTQIQGTDGFGYDPVFYVPSENKSAAELSPERKNHLSHRGLALKKLIALLKLEQENVCKHSP